MSKGVKETLNAKGLLEKWNCMKEVSTGFFFNYMPLTWCSPFVVTA